MNSLQCENQTHKTVEKKKLLERMTFYAHIKIIILRPASPHLQTIHC